MTKATAFLRRADRAVAIGLFLALTTATGAASYGSYGDDPSTDHHPANYQGTALLRGTMTEPDRVAASVPLPDNMMMATPSAVETAMVKFAADQRCLAEAMYYEARGEGVEGEEAVAEVVFHRLHRRGYPTSICGIVYQGASDGVGCQFSFVCDGEMKHPKSPVAWARANLLAAKIMNGYTVLGNSTDGAISFHAADVEPDWSANLERTVQIGNHVFYKPLAHTRAS